MNLRNYNIYFNTHTISGIIISAVLYVIFFAGSFAFFKNEISNWQKNTPNNVAAKRSIDYNRIIDSLSKKYSLYGREVSLTINPHSPQLRVFIAASKDTTDKTKGGFFYLDTKTCTLAEYKANYDLGEFLYRLHFLAQVNGIAKLGFPLGYYIAGGVAFIFLFALITGVLVHWQKIVSNFYIFRPWEKLKTVWTDLHTALGVISFPFLFVFAVTGSYFLIGFPLFTKPTVAYQFEGKQDSLNTVLGFGEHDIKLAYSALGKKADINHFVDEAMKKWPNIRINSVQAVNYGDSSMQVHIGGAAPTTRKFVSEGELVYEVASGKELEHKDPMAPTTYAQVADNALYSLHFGNYGGYATKILYFLLGISGCVIIISGVLIWLVARKKNNIPERKRKFNQGLATVYMAICIGMFPVTAAAFVAVKINPTGGMDFIYSFYFWSWLAVSTLLVIRKDLYKINRDCMLAGGIIGLCVPIVNGIATGNWIWNSYSQHYHDIMLIDLFWLFVSAGALISWRLIIRHHKKSLQKQASQKVSVRETVEEEV